MAVGKAIPLSGSARGREIGFRYFEIFGASFCATKDGLEAPPRDTQKLKAWPDGYSWKYPTGPRKKREVYYPDRWEALQHRMYEIGAQFTAITGGALGGSVAFHDPAQRKDVIDNHFNMTRFSRRFGCDHQKTNTGPRKQPGGTPDADLKEIAITCDLLGKRIREELGMKFGGASASGQPDPERARNLVHHGKYQARECRPDPGYRPITMAGMDPVALGKKYGHRVIEYHLKDTGKADRGGTKNVPTPARDMMNDPYFYPMGEGGGGFPGHPRLSEIHQVARPSQCRAGHLALAPAQGKRAHHRQLYPQHFETRAVEITRHDEHHFFPLPDDWRDAVLVGRLDLGEGPTPVVVKEGRVFDVSATAPTTAQLLEKWSGVPSGKDLGDINDLGLATAWSEGAQGR